MPEASSKNTFAGGYVRGSQELHVILIGLLLPWLIAKHDKAVYSFN
jgi:hypothetical protein